MGWTFSLAAMALLAAPGCGSSAARGFSTTTADGGARPVSADGGGGLVGGPEGGSLVGSDASQPGASSYGPAVVYGQSATTLYAVDPTTKAVTKVGDFQGCGDEVIDLALDRSSQMYATSTDGVYTVDRTTAVCHLLAAGTYPNSLSFVPAGTVDPNVEALVGYNGSTYVRIDTTTGAITTIGDLGKGYASSGDIVSVIGGGTYLTVTGGEACASSDCLVEVDPKSGALLTNYGALGYSGVYGLAFWAGTVYGFDAAGDLFQVTFTPPPMQVAAIPIPSAPAGLSFYGAGSTTSAPPVPTAK